MNQKLMSPNNIDTTLFYFTGTGNSLWTARALARELGNTEVISMINWKANPRPLTTPIVGLVFPVHVWGVPRLVLEFLDELGQKTPQYLFAVATNGGQVANTLVQLQKEVKSRGLALANGWSVELPSNYIPWGGPGSAEKQNQLFEAAGVKVTTIADQVNKRVRSAVEKGPLWQRIIFTGINKLTYPRIPAMDSGFWVDEHCDQCSLCVKVCPTKNLAIMDGNLVWHHQCSQCLACLQWCPHKSLQYGKKTPAYERYHHPQIKLKDLLGQ